MYFLALSKSYKLCKFLSSRKWKIVANRRHEKEGMSKVSHGMPVCDWRRLDVEGGEVLREGSAPSPGYPESSVNRLTRLFDLTVAWRWGKVGRGYRGRTSWTTRQVKTIGVYKENELTPRPRLIESRHGRGSTGINGLARTKLSKQRQLNVVVTA